MRNIKSLLYTALAGLLFISCSKDNADLSVVNLEGEFIINAGQRLTPQGPDFLLEVSTLSEYDCMTADIVYDIALAEGGTNIIIKNISDETDCAAGKGQVVENIPITTNGQNTALSLSLRDVVMNRGIVEVTDDEYILDMKSSDGFILAKNTIRRIPNNLIFGQIEFPNGSSINELLSILKLHNTDVIEDGDYGIFTKRDKEINVLLEVESGDAQGVFFTVDDRDAFLVSLQNVRLEYPDFTIRLKDARGVEL